VDVKFEMSFSDGEDQKTEDSSEPKEELWQRIYLDQLLFLCMNGLPNKIFLLHSSTCISFISV
jgi:hypothetical protein